MTDTELERIIKTYGDFRVFRSIGITIRVAGYGKTYISSDGNTYTMALNNLYDVLNRRVFHTVRFLEGMV